MDKKTYLRQQNKIGLSALALIILLIIVTFSLPNQDVKICSVTIASILAIAIIIRLFNILKVNQQKWRDYSKDSYYIKYVKLYGKNPPIPENLNGKKAILIEEVSTGFQVFLEDKWKCIKNFVRKLFHKCSSQFPIKQYIDVMYYFNRKDFVLQNREWKSNFNHNAVIICPSRGFDAEYYAFGPDILIEFFIKNLIPYAVYVPQTIGEFEDILKNDCAQVLWLFGHGDIGGFRITINELVHYNKYRCDEWQKHKKIAIHQLHCNCKNLRSPNPLSKILVDGWDYHENGKHYSQSNRAYVEAILKITDKVPGIWDSISR